MTRRLCRLLPRFVGVWLAVLTLGAALSPSTGYSYDGGSHDRTPEGSPIATGPTLGSESIRGYDRTSNLARTKSTLERSVLATKGASGAERGGLNLFKWKDPTSTTASGWRDGDRMLTVPWKGTPKATWKENASRLRREMRSGDPIYESYVDKAGNLIPTKGFLNAERNLLSNRGWQYDPRTRSWASGR